jgi:hypothetical protein
VALKPEKRSIRSLFRFQCLASQQDSFRASQGFNEREIQVCQLLGFNVPCLVTLEGCAPDAQPVFACTRTGIGHGLLDAANHVLVQRHLDFYALLRMLRNPLALHWTLLPLVG